MLYQILNAYLIALAPIIPHTCEEAYQHFNKTNKQKSVHLEYFDAINIKLSSNIDLKKWSKFFELKDLVYSEIEKARNEKKIASKGIATVVISTKNELPFDVETLKKYFNVAKVIHDKNSDEISIKIENTDFARCERCWNYYPNNEINEQLCNRCLNVIKN